MQITLTTKTLERLDRLTHWLNTRLGLPIVRPICDAYQQRLEDGSPWLYRGANAWTSAGGEWTAATSNVTFTYHKPKHF